MMVLPINVAIYHTSLHSLSVLSRVQLQLSVSIQELHDITIYALPKIDYNYIASKQLISVTVLQNNQLLCFNKGQLCTIVHRLHTATLVRTLHMPVLLMFRCGF